MDDLTKTQWRAKMLRHSGLFEAEIKLIMAKMPVEKPQNSPLFYL